MPNTSGGGGGKSGSATGKSASSGKGLMSQSYAERGEILDHMSLPQLRQLEAELTKEWKQAGASGDAKGRIKAVDVLKQVKQQLRYERINAGEIKYESAADAFNKANTGYFPTSKKR